MKKVLLLGMILVLAASGCSGFSVSTSASPTLTAEPNSPPTATIDWFPTTPTPTHTLAPTLEPTPDMRPELGKVIYEDDFSNRSLWETGVTSDGSIAYGVNEITLAISQPQKALTTQPYDLQMDDFYLEITANPSLCSENDVYGILFRVNSRYDYYRLLVSCAGKVRIERIRQATTSVLQDWVIAGNIPPGAPLMVRLGLWVSGSSIRLFAGDFFLFEVEDDSFSSGSIGLYARSGGTTPLTVNFRNMVIYQVADAVPSPASNLTVAPKTDSSLTPTSLTATPARTTTP